MSHLPASTVVLALAMTSASAALAGEQAITVTFDQGKTSKQVMSSITGEAGAEYLLAAKQGQVLHLLFSTSKGTWGPPCSPKTRTSPRSSRHGGRRLRWWSSRAGTRPIDAFENSSKVHDRDSGVTAA